MAGPRPIESEIAAYKHGRVPRELRERQLLELAEELFAERGYEGTSMDELARRAGISKPVVYSLVGSKEELFRRCFDRAGKELQDSVIAAAAGAADLESLLRATALAFFEFVRRHEGAWRMLFSAEMGGPAANHAHEIRARQARLVEGLLDAWALERGVALDPQRAGAVAFAINGAYEFMAHWWRGNPGSSAEDLADWGVRFTLPGIEALLKD